MLLSELVKGHSAKMVGPDVDIQGMAHDSRRVSAGHLYAALAGSAGDGHRFIDDAIAKGACAILSENVIEVPAGITAVQVPQARKAWAEIAQRFVGMPHEHLLMVGITGTNGKSTTAHLIAQLLVMTAWDGKSVNKADVGQGSVGVLGTLGNRLLGMDGKNQDLPSMGLTTPDAIELAQVLAAIEHGQGRAAVMEVSSHGLVQERVSGVLFDVGVFSNLTQDHLDYHGTLEAYFEAKTRLFLERLSPTGVAVLNYDDPYGQRLMTLMECAKHPAKVMSYSAQGAEAATVFASDTTLGAGGMEFTVHEQGQDSVKVQTSLVGRFNIDNLLAAYTAMRALGVPATIIAAAMPKLLAVPGRFERVSTAGQPLVVVDYSHTPDALEKALEAMGEIVRGDIHCVFGCGGDRDRDKRPLMAKAVCEGAHHAIITNDNPRTEDPGAIAADIEAGMAAGFSYTVRLDRQVAIEEAVAQAKAEDGVLIAGKGHEDYQIVGTQKRDFDDRKVARDALSKMLENGLPTNIRSTSEKDSG